MNQRSPVRLRRSCALIVLPAILLAGGCSRDTDISEKVARAEAAAERATRAAAAAESAARAAGARISREANFAEPDESALDDDDGGDVSSENDGGPEVVPTTNTPDIAEAEGGPPARIPSPEG